MDSSQFTRSQYFQTPGSVGRGRGLLGAPIPFPEFSSDVGCSVGMAAHALPPLIRDSPHTAPTQQDSSSTHQLPYTSTPLDLVGQMGNIVQHIGQQLADSILTHLSRPSPTAAIASTHTQDSHTPAQDFLSSSSQLHVVSQRKVRDPPTFRGDSSDSVTLEEWIELMRTFIRKGGLPTEEQGEEILIHLRGKAKDVVRVGMKSSGVDIRSNPDVMYSLLRKHFSCQQFSPLPLQDFYTTLPEPQEDPYDYWLRLNRAADVTAECLKEQGKQQDNLSIEVTRMFIRNCPNSDLALTFRSKTIDKWSASEVQEVLNEYHSEKFIRAAGKRKDKTVLEKEVAVNRIEVATSPAPLCNPRSPQQSAPTDHSSLERIISMLEKVLMSNAQSRPTSRKPSGLPRIQGLNDTPCLVCKDSSHSALSHCRDNRLCFQCFSPDHPRNKCPHRGGSATPISQPSN
ncbi:uncharacterized protein LOC143118592 [Alosa pseudoharengus]|uniref:uncharacterized protein LOC143118592 n=1 Tax=Alosa pseudoharengus TaxID=34774 RepID=UPI003F8A9EBB